MVLASSDQVEEKVTITFIFLYRTYYFPKEGVQVYWSVALHPFIVFLDTEVCLGFFGRFDKWKYSYLQHLVSKKTR